MAAQTALPNGTGSVNSFAEILRQKNGSIAKDGSTSFDSQLNMGGQDNPFAAREQERKLAHEQRHAQLTQETELFNRQKMAKETEVQQQIEAARLEISQMAQPINETETAIETTLSMPTRKQQVRDGSGSLAFLDHVGREIKRALHAHDSNEWGTTIQAKKGAARGPGAFMKGQKGNNATRQMQQMQNPDSAQASAWSGAG